MTQSNCLPETALPNQNAITNDQTKTDEIYIELVKLRRSGEYKKGAKLAEPLLIKSELTNKVRIECSEFMIRTEQYYKAEQFLLPVLTDSTTTDDEKARIRISKCLRLRNKIPEADSFSAEGLKKYPKSRGLTLERGISSFRSKSWSVSADCFSDLIENHGASEKNVFVRCLTALRLSKKFDKFITYYKKSEQAFPGDAAIRDEYIKFLMDSGRWREACHNLSRKIRDDAESPRIEDYLNIVMSARKIRDYLVAEKYISLAKSVFHDTHKGQNLLFNEQQSITSIESHTKNAPLLIVFQGFIEKHIKDCFSENGKDDLNYLNFSQLPYAMMGFAKKYPEFNYIFVKDNFQTWYQINTEKYTESINAIIKKLNPRKIVCTGNSAGAFAAIMFGNYLGADITYAFAPRCIAFTTSIIPFREELNKTYMLSLNDTADLGTIQAKSGGFRSKVKIYYCEDMEVDKDGVSNLDLTDENLEINAMPCSTHYVIKDIGKDYFFDKISSALRE